MEKAPTLLTRRGKLVLTVLLLGGVGLGVWRWSDRIWPKPPKPHYESGIILVGGYHWGNLEEFTNSILKTFDPHKMEFFQPNSIALRNWEQSIILPPVVKMEWTVKGELFSRRLEEVEINGYWPNNSRFQKTIRANDWHGAVTQAKLHIDAEVKRLHVRSGKQPP